MGRLGWVVIAILTVGTHARAEDRATWIKWLSSARQERVDAAIAALKKEGHAAFADVLASLETGDAAGRLLAIKLLVAYSEGLDDVDPFATGLLKALKEPNKRIAAGAAQILRKAGPKTFPKLYKLLHGKDERLADLARIAIVDCGKSAVPYLSKRLGSKSRPTLLRALGTLELLGTSAAAARAAVEPHLSDQRLEVRLAAYRAATAIEPDAGKAVALLLKALEDPARECLSQACELLAGHPKEATAALAKRVEGPPSLRRDCAIHVLSILGGEAAPAVAQLLGSKKEATRLAALRLLVEVGATNPTEARVAALLRDGSPAERVESARYISLCSVDDDLVEKLLAKLIDDKQAAVGDWAWFRGWFARTKVVADRKPTDPEVLIRIGETDPARYAPILTLAQDANIEKARPALRAMGTLARAYVLGTPRMRTARFAALPEKVRASCDRAWKWLQANQQPDGSWRAGFAGREVGITALALLAFSGGGHTDQSGRYAKTVDKGLRALLNRRDKLGVFGPENSRLTTIQQAMATAALMDAQLVGSCPYARDASVEAARWLFGMQAYPGGWAYTRKDNPDMFHTVWAAYAARLGTLAGLIPMEAYREDVLGYLGKMTDDEFGQVGYDVAGGNPGRPKGQENNFPPEKSQSMTAAGNWLRGLLHVPFRKSKIAKLGLKLVQDVPPTWNETDGSIDMAYWCFGANAIAMETLQHARIQKENRKWADQLVKVLLENQQEDGAWLPVGAWGSDGGKVFSTSTCLLSLLAPIQFSGDFGLGPRAKPVGIYAEARKILDKARKSDDPRRAFAAYVALR